jgi:hypothetical protein
MFLLSASDRISNLHSFQARLVSFTKFQANLHIPASRKPRCPATRQRIRKLAARGSVWHERELSRRSIR